ncbi:GNAT family N-acetyltransferase [Paenibacillus sp. FSL R5-0766]|uniref:GNAT family N-acetyltransferase n=1 Tax=unclassified Paenibacillus TaxID=185978 RepID=UPI00096C53FA|nr:GNAT family N-acetyltransferase [Paenibacillus sp. FSL R5-0765]OMF61591.1 GNAT family N-acetyltransferase [Paenibacillus sp. FSL R5-0765]
MSVIDNMRPFMVRDLAMLEEWFKDAEVHRRLEGMLPLDEWHQHVQQHPGYDVWVAFSQGKAVGVSMIEQEEQNTGSIAIVVDPSVRGRGCGRAVIGKAMQLPKLETIHKWYAGIEADNAACLKCFQSTGFVLENEAPDEDGYFSLWHIANIKV